MFAIFRPTLLRKSNKNDVIIKSLHIYVDSIDVLWCVVYAVDLFRFESALIIECTLIRVAAFERASNAPIKVSDGLTMHSALCNLIL